MLIHWIWLAARSGIGDHGRLALLSRYEDPEQIYFAPESEFSEQNGFSPEAAESFRDRDLSGAQKILDTCLALKIHILTLQDAGYPHRLKNIPDPPLVLYYRGTLPELDGEVAIGVVGTRKASAYGLGIAKRMGYQIGACGGIVVSGAAFGIDSMAMNGALTAGAPVVGVLGCGVDVIYPKSSKGLYADLERYGCILSEYPPGTKPVGFHFPRRNRIISGLSCGVLVVEAPIGSGALITARHAADQGRDVFVVPSNIDVDTGAGSNGLLRDGAIAVSSGWDVVSEYEAVYPGRVHPQGQGAQLQVYPDEVRKVQKLAQKPEKIASKPPEKPKHGKKPIDKPENEPYIDTIKTPIALTPEEAKIRDLLTGGQMLVDDAIAESGLGAAQVLAALTMLEVKGVIRRLPGRIIALAGK